MHVQPCGAERPVAIVSIRRLEVASILWVSYVPKTTAEVCYDRQGRMQPGNLIHKRSIVRHGTNTVKQATLFFLELTQHTIHRVQRRERQTLLVILRRHGRDNIFLSYALCLLQCVESKHA